MALRITTKDYYYRSHEVNGPVVMRLGQQSLVEKILKLHYYTELCGYLARASGYEDHTDRRNLVHP